MVWIAIAFALVNSFFQERYVLGGFEYSAITIFMGVLYWLLSFVVFSQRVSDNNLTFGYFMFLVANLIFGLPVVMFGVVLYYLNDPKRIKKTAEA